MNDTGEKEEMAPPMVTMTQDQLAEALADLERLAKSGGMSTDDIAEIYQDRLDELEDE